MIAYEIHSCRDGRWRVDATFDGFDIAELEARRIAERGYDQGVLVIKENYNPDTNKASWRTVYRAGRFSNRVWGNLAAMRRISERTHTKQRLRQRKALLGDDRDFRPRTAGFIKPMLALILISFIGLAAIYGIERVAALLG